MIDRPLLANRLRESYNYLRSCGVVHTISEFAETVGKSQGDISNALAARGRVMTIGLLERVADTYPEYLSKEYLLKGIGDIKAFGKNRRPHIEAKASAGFMDGLSEGDYGKDLRPLITEMPDYDFTITAQGNSMFPKIEDGDSLACRIINDKYNPPIGKICVIDSKEGAAVKVIKSIGNDRLCLHSLNPKYKDYDVSFLDLNKKSIALVVGLVRSFV